MWLIAKPVLIKGMVGVGKTTLARQLVTLDGDSLLLEEMDNQSLGNMLFRHLGEMPQWFIVLDNVLPEMCFKSFLLDLARLSQPIDKITSVENKFTKELERKGREMLKKCGGLPIAIIDVGREKAKQRLLGIEWEELFDSIDLSKTLKLLEPMYLELDENLKPCFLHMSFFKENAIMREEKLHHIWAANGVETDIAPCASLVGQSIIEVVHPYPERFRVKRCRMNPVLHMLSIKKAEEEIGLEILRNNGNNRPLVSPRHRVIHCGRVKFNHSANQDKYLVSLIFHGGGRYLDDAGQSYWKNFEHIKILDIEDFGAKTISESIGTLTELRYLGLRNNYVEEIPHSLEGLKELEVLDIALNFMVEVPDIIKEMGGLRHLYMSDVICRKPLEVDALQKLKTLTFMSIYSWIYEASNLEKMTSLHKLGVEEIDENSDVSELFPSLAKLKELNHLILRGFRFRMMSCLDEIRVLHMRRKIRTLRLDGCIARLPTAYSFPREIKYLALVNTCLDENPMPILMKLSSLRRLKLRNAYNGRELVFKMMKLQILCISELWNLREVRFEECEDADLEQLEIMNCPHLETLPQEIRSMRRMEKFKMLSHQLPANSTPTSSKKAALSFTVMFS
ncbi:disease resistance RPP8-like protein 3 [Salvia hispanica]|uniref:disease resistance RPP8-like protein 3 n=1 Tax=Salvia hispanica TaxID=49212 RepID=UPI002009CEEB|nr:disease resistance RPP8-like protein 3 [Salvia hispanica]